MNNMLFTKNVLIASTVMLVFFVTLLVAPYYLNGDQAHYNLVYKELAELSLRQGYLFYNVSLSSFEYIHFILSWVASRFIDKDVFIAISNSFLAYSILINFEKKRVFILLSVFIVISNFYIFVLYFAAERLKFAMIFFMLSFYYIERTKLFVCLGFISVNSHAQFFILYASVFAIFLKSKFTRLYETGFLSKYVLYISLFLICTLSLLYEQITTKFLAYDSGIASYWKILVFFTLSLWYATKRQNVVLVFLPLFLAVFLFGGERVNLFGYFVFMYYALQVNGGLNVGVIITSMYFSYKTYEFLQNIISFGNGFYVP